VIDAGLAQEIVVDGTEVAEGISFLPIPGHSIDHACIRFSSRGEQALFWGDVMHHPLQTVTRSSAGSQTPPGSRADGR
jgi:glyoxylase-like metal-dependent hydrolase (beta-lactamase superfamily II)